MQWHKIEDVNYAEINANESNELILAYKPEAHDKLVGLLVFGPTLDALPPYLYSYDERFMICFKYRDAKAANDDLDVLLKTSETTVATDYCSDIENDDDDDSDFDADMAEDDEPEDDSDSAMKKNWEKLGLPTKSGANLIGFDKREELIAFIKKFKGTSHFPDNFEKEVVKALDIQLNEKIKAAKHAKEMQHALTATIKDLSVKIQSLETKLAVQQTQIQSLKSKLSEKQEETPKTRITLHGSF